MWMKLLTHESLRVPNISLVLGLSLLIALHASLDLMACRAATPLVLCPNPDFIVSLLFGIELGQATLLGLFLAMAPAPLWLRVAIVATGGAFIGWVFVYSGTLPPPLGWVGMVVFVAGPFAASAMAAWVLRFRAGYLIQSTYDPAHKLPHPLRYGLRDLFGLITLIALVLGLARWLREILTEPWLVVAALGAMPLLAGLLAQSLAAVWATLSPGPAFRRCAAIIPITIVGGSAFPFVGKSSPELYAMVCAPLIIQACLLVGSLLVFRALGYRLGRSQPRTDYYALLISSAEQKRWR
jgi:hypothetical protein